MKITSLSRFQLYNTYVFDLNDPQCTSSTFWKSYGIL